MKKTMIITIILFITMTTVVGCGSKNEPIVTNDLLHRETKEVSGASASFS